MGNVLSIFGINNVKKNAELYQVAIKSIAGSQTSKKYTWNIATANMVISHTLLS